MSTGVVVREQENRDEIEPDSRKRKKTAFITADLDKLKKAYTSLCFDKRNPLIAVMRQDTEDVQKSTNCHTALRRIERAEVSKTESVVVLAEQLFCKLSLSDTLHV